MQTNKIKTLKYILLALLLGGMAKASAQSGPVSPIPIPERPSNLLPGKKAPAVTDVWVVFKTHCDLGYTTSAKEVFNEYRENMMDNALRLIEADRKKPVDDRFKWTIAGWPMKGVILGPLQTPERKLKVEQALREGTINVHALPVTLESDAMDQEDYVRGLIFSSQVSRAYGHELPIAAKMTDVPAHSWFLPTLLHQAGIKFIQIGCNGSYRSPLLPQLFWWIGPDGSKVLCNYTTNYGSSAKPPVNWPSKNYLAVFMTSDNEGPPSAKEIEDVKKQVAELKGVKLHFATLDEYAKAVLAENPAIPTVKGDMVDPWIHGVMAMPQATKTARNVRPLESALDVFNTQLNGWGLAAGSLLKELGLAYENSILFGEHTWGAKSPGWGFFSMDGKTKGIERYLYNDAFVKAREAGFYKKFEASFRDKAAYINTTDSIVSTQLNRRLNLLASSVKARADEYIVYNPLSWTRSGLVVISGKKVWVDNVPANGYQTISLPKETAPTSLSNPSMLNTRFYTVRFDAKRGGIASMIEKASGKEMVDQNSKYALAQYLHERFSCAQTIDYYNRCCNTNNSFNTTKPNMPRDITYAAITPDNWEIQVEHSSAADVVTLTSKNSSPLAKSVAVVFTFNTAQPFVDVEWKIDGKVANTVPEGGWLCFPFNVNKPKYILGRLGGAMDLAKDQLVGGNRYLYAVQNGTSVVAPDQSGIGLCAIDAPLLSFGEPGLWKYDYSYFPKQPTVFVNLYNNMWNVNFPYWTEGSWTERVRIWGIQAGVKTNENLAIQSWEARLPLMTVKASGTGTKLPSRQSGIVISRKGILVTAFGEDPDGNKGRLLRLWEQGGNSGIVSITLPVGRPFRKATPVNLRGEISGKSLNIIQGKFSYDIKAFGSASFILE
jgi:hypothetical protein